MKEEKNTTKDIWDKADVIVKASAAVLVSGAIALYGITSEKKKTEIAEENRRSQIIMQTMNSRETAVADMRAKMFDTLMTHYFVGPGGESPNEKNKLRILQLIALNFQDNFQLTPLFEDLYASLGNNPEAKGELRKVVRAIARGQIDRLVGNGGKVCKLDLRMNVPVDVPCAAPLRLTLLEVREDRILVSVSPTQQEKEAIEVTYFDMPFVDNTRIGELKYSIALSNIKSEEGKAVVKVVMFPEHYFSGRDSLRFDQMIGDSLVKEYGR